MSNFFYHKIIVTSNHKIALSNGVQGENRAVNLIEGTPNLRNEIKTRLLVKINQVTPQIISNGGVMLCLGIEKEKGLFIFSQPQRNVLSWHTLGTGSGPNDVWKKYWNSQHFIQGPSENYQRVNVYFWVTNRSECDSKAVTIELLKKSAFLSQNTKMLLNPSLIRGLIKAEAQEMPWYESIYDGGGIGPGQMYEPATTDVRNRFPNELKKFVERMNWCENKNIQVGNHQHNATDPVLSDFFIGAYLGIRLQASQRTGRLPDEVLKYGIGGYHGARLFRQIQQSERPNDYKNNRTIPFSVIEGYVNKPNGNKDWQTRLKEILTYIKTVTTHP